MQIKSASALIVLQPDPDMSEIMSSYIALSYVWGDATDIMLVYVEGGVVLVITSLDCVTRHVVHRTKERQLWADALCRNQSDVDKRNQQVAIMNRIYLAARHTVIFLGECTEISHLLLKNWMSYDFGYNVKFSRSISQCERWLNPKSLSLHCLISYEADLASPINNHLTLRALYLSFALFRHNPKGSLITFTLCLNASTRLERASLSGSFANWRDED